MNIDKKQGKVVITPEEAKDVFLGFLEAFDKKAGNYSRTGENRKAASVDIIPSSFLDSRSSLGNDTSFYLVNLQDSAGFGIINPFAQKKDEPQIIVFVENENISIEDIKAETNPGFQLFLMYARYQLENTVDDGPVTNGGNSMPMDTIIDGWYINEYYKPMLKTKWGQGCVVEPDSYGQYCPNKVAGCVPVAAAQILAYYQTINSVSWSQNGQSGYSVLDWDEIIADSQAGSGRLGIEKQKSMSQVAHLNRYLGVCFDSTYKFEEDPAKNHTSTKSAKAISWFKDWSGLCASDLKKYDEDSIIYAIKNGRLVYMKGSATEKHVLFIPYYEDGHAWVCDGYINGFKDGRREKLIHCNWGWNGTRDGYFASKVFNANVEPLISDGSNDPNVPNEANFRYCLEYSVIYKLFINL